MARVAWRLRVAAQALEFREHGFGVAIGLRPQPLQLAHGGLGVGAGALGELLDQGAGAAFGVGDGGFERGRVSSHDLVDFAGLAGETLQGIAELALPLLQGGIHAQVGLFQGAGGTHHRLALLIEARGRGGDLLQQALRNVLQRVGLARQPLDGVQRLARDAVARAPDGVDAVEHGFIEGAGLTTERVGQRTHMVLHGDGERASPVVHGRIDGERRADHGIVEQRQALGERRIERAGPLHQRHIERFRAASQGRIQRHSVVVEHGLELLSAVGEGVLQTAAGRGKLIFERDQVLTGPFDDFGELDLLLRQLVDQGWHVAAHRLQRLCHLVGGADQGVTLANQFLDQAFDLVLVLAVGFLQCGDLVVHQGFELARPSQRPRNGIVHERDLAAYGLAEGGGGLLGGAIGLGQTHGHFGHGRGH